MLLLVCSEADQTLTASSTHALGHPSCYEVAMPVSDIRLLLRRPGYGKYFAVVASSRATGTMFNVAGVLLILERTGNLVLAGVTVAAATLPGAITGPFLGAWLDVTKSRRRLLVLDRLLTAAALGGLLGLAGHAPNWLLPLVAVAYGAGSPLSNGAFSSMLPEIVGPDLLDVANTFEATSINVAFIVGPVLSGLLAGLAGPAIAIETQLVAGLVLIPLIAGDESFELRPPPRGRAPHRLLAAVSEGMGNIRHIRALRFHALASVASVTAWGSLVVGFPLYAESVHARAAASGYMWAAIALGSMMSAFVFRVRALAIAPNVLICVSFIVMGLSVALWPLADGLGGALALIALTGVLEGPSLVAAVGVRQRLAPSHLRAQIFATIFSLDVAAGALGSAVAGPIHSGAGTTVTLLFCGALLCLAGILSFAMGST